MNGAFLMPNDDNRWKISEALFSLPPDERPAALAKLVKEGKAIFLGETAKTAPELAIECIKKGINAKSYVKAKKGTE